MIRVVLFDRDGTLVENIENVIDPQLFRAMPTALSCLQFLRSLDVRIGVVTNQPRIGRKMLSMHELELQHAHIETLVGKIDAWFVCPHHEHENCTCRKPAPGLIEQAAKHFAVLPSECVVVGDIADDMRAAQRAGASAILVPNAVTKPDEISRARYVANTLLEAAYCINEWMTSASAICELIS